jgi:sugar lactone lactonase YvrE
LSIAVEKRAAKTKMKNALVCLLLAVAATGCHKNKMDAPPSNPVQKGWIVTTVAGDGTEGSSDGPVKLAKFHAPIDVAVAPDGTVYVADYLSHRIRRISNGQVSTLAGSDSTGIVDGRGGQARFRSPYRVTTDPNGNIYVLDEVDARIRKITPTGDVTVYAGLAQPGFMDGPAASAQFLINAGGLASDRAGNIYVGDTFNGRIRAISLAGTVTTVAGDGKVGLLNGGAKTAEFRYATSVAADKDGNLYVADAGNFYVRQITPIGLVAVMAGSGVRGYVDGVSIQVQFDQMDDMVVDSKGNVFVIDNNSIRKVTPQGAVSTIAGAEAGYADGDGVTARFRNPGGLGIDAQDNIYVADINNNRIRKISFH